jgi:hypothetical protein
VLQYSLELQVLVPQFGASVGASLDVSPPVSTPASGPGHVHHLPSTQTAAVVQS